MLRWSHTILAAGSVAALAAAGSAGARAAAPTGAFAPFKQCPLSASGVNECFYSRIVSGEFTIGSQTVDITNPLVLQGGLIQDGDQQTFVQPDPSVAWALPQRAQRTTVLGIPITATAWLVRNPSYSFTDFANASGTAVTLPIDIHLQDKQGLLGPDCYLGSFAFPITINLTDGTTTPPTGVAPLTGSPGALTFKDNANLIVARGAQLVDNDFYVPGAYGCGQDGSLDTTVDSTVGLPAQPGVSEAVLDGVDEQAAAQAVIDHTP